jgi:uroporphyrinogen-III decarboxylase
MSMNNTRRNGINRMNSKERIKAALEGKSVDRMPVTVLYNHLYHLDHFAELTGKPAWQRRAWCHAAPHEHAAVLKQMLEKVPLEIVQPQGAPSREMRERIVFFEKDGAAFCRDTKTGAVTPLAESAAGHADDYAANETQTVFSVADFNARFKLVKAERILEDGSLDYVQAAVRTLGKDHFICSGGFVSILWDCIPYVGQTNMLTMLIDNPGLIEYMGHKLLDQSIESIKAYGAVGGDALYIDDAMGYSDVISVAHYERFSLPYLTEMVREIHQQGMKAILIYFGGVADRLEQIVSTGADGLSVETTMKNYVNDIQDISRKIGGRISLFGNIDPVGVLQKGSDQELKLEIQRQAQAAQTARGFIMCTGSPITPATPLARVRLFIDLARKIKG